MPTITFERAGVTVPVPGGRRVVLEPTDLEIAEQRVGVIGANGSGKSTLARLVNGLVEATKTGKEQDATLSIRAKQRSIHNNYLTFPLLFLMLSNHFPSATGHPLNWLVLIAVMIGGAGVMGHGCINPMEYGSTTADHHARNSRARRMPPPAAPLPAEPAPVPRGADRRSKRSSASSPALLPQPFASTPRERLGCSRALHDGRLRRPDRPAHPDAEGPSLHAERHRYRRAAQGRDPARRYRSTPSQAGRLSRAEAAIIQ